MRTFPLDLLGSAADAAPLLGAAHGLTIEDRTAWPRWGLKGPGAAGWMEAAGLALPGINRWGGHGAFIILRLGTNDVTLLGNPALSDDLTDLRTRWEHAPAGRGWPSWREDGWAWLALSGPSLPGVLARMCALDLRPGRFGPDAIAQTRFAHLDAVVICRDGGAEILFDITATAGALRDIAAAARAASLGELP
jgi:sarcosine oxidase, subunit gamma